MFANILVFILRESVKQMLILLLNET